MAISEGSPQGEWDKIVEKMMLIFSESARPIFRATIPLSRGVLQTKVVVNCRYIIAPTRERLKLCFAQIFLLINSIITKQSTKCVINVTLVMIEQTHLWWKNNRTHRSCPVWSWQLLQDDGWFCTRKTVTKMSGTNWKSVRTRQNEQFLYWCRNLDYSWSEMMLLEKFFFSDLFKVI